MNKPYTQTEDSDSGLHVSMVSDCSIPDDELTLGCNECWNGLSHQDALNNIGIDFEWKDLGDNGVLCPACAEREDNNDALCPYCEGEGYTTIYPIGDHGMSEEKYCEKCNGTGKKLAVPA